MAKRRTHKMHKSTPRRELIKDVFFIFLGACVAYALSQSGLIDGVVQFLGSYVLAAFVAGIFFTSVFTIAPATVALMHLAAIGPIGEIAIIGALGAVCGDLILFFFIRDRFYDDLMKSLRPGVARHILSSFHLGFMKWLSPILGALIIASPIPDEFGLALMGMSKIHISVLVPVSFVMNVIGIYAVLWLEYTVFL